MIGSDKVNFTATELAVVFVAVKLVANLHLQKKKRADWTEAITPQVSFAGAKLAADLQPQKRLGASKLLQVFTFAVGNTCR